LNFTPGSVLGGKAFGGEWLIRRRARDIRRRRGSFFLDPGEQSGLNRGGRPLLFNMIVGETTGFEDYGAQLGDAAATRVVEVHKRKTGPGHRVLQERDRRCSSQAMLAAQMQKSAHKAMAAVSVAITAARPVAVVGKCSSIRSSICTACAIWASAIGLSGGGRGVSASAGAGGLQEVLETEMTEAVGAEKGERTAERRSYRSGYYGRSLITRVGKLELRVPQHRAGAVLSLGVEEFDQPRKIGERAGQPVNLTRALTGPTSLDCDG
jgi:hypothetical protein